MEYASNTFDIQDNRIQVLPEVNVSSIVKEITNNNIQDVAFYICDVGNLIRKHQIWKETMPRVTTHYAVKCNNSRIVLETLAALGTGFDCASKEEIRMILSLGVHPDRIIYANPAKYHGHLKFAAETEVSQMTFDGEEELYKIKSIFPNAKLLIRIKCDDPSALYVLGNKYGCDSKTEAAELLKIAYHLQLNVIGVAFHIGSGSKNYSTYRKAIASARHVFDEAAKIGYKFSLLDIGGGYPGEDFGTIKEIGKIINKAIEEYFPDPNVKITSEPGKYYVNSAFTLAFQIQSRKTITNESNEKSYIYYANTSVYGALIPIIYNEDYIFKPVTNKENGKLYQSVIWGSTCDAYDRLAKDIMLPEIEIGDWILAENAGAYTLSLSCEFNGMETPRLHAVVNEREWIYLTENAPYPMSEKKFVLGNSKENYRTGLIGPSRYRTNYF